MGPRATVSAPPWGGVRLRVHRRLHRLRRLHRRVHLDVCCSGGRVAVTSGGVEVGPLGAVQGLGALVEVRGG